MNLITVSHLGKKINQDDILQDINFSLQPFQKLAIAGATGSGKSTLLKIIAGLVQPGSGEVLFETTRVKGPEEKLLPGHPRIAYLSQHFELRNNYRVEEELSYTNQLSEKDAEAIFQVCRIEHLLKRKTDQLSGGEKQRIALARLLISSPKLLLLDEPFSNLDRTHKAVMKGVINEVCERLKITCVLVSHDPLDALSWGDEIIILNEGKIIQKGTPEQVYRQPSDEYVAGLFGTYNLLTAAQASAFSILPDPALLSKRILVRPEDMKIVQAPGGMEGIVQQVHYYGSHYEADIALMQIIITIHTGEKKLVAGDKIYLAFAPEKLWYV